LTLRAACRWLALALALAQAGAAPAGDDLLFDSVEPLAVTIEGPIRDLVRQRRHEPKLPGVLRYTDAAGTEHALDVELGVRGRSRLAMCDFPPMRLKFGQDQVEGTLFEGMRTLKLVTRCKRPIRAADWATLEYGAYRAYNAVTPNSYRVRLLHLTFTDTDPRAPEVRQIAFVIEPEALVEARLGLVNVRPPEVLPEQLSPADTAHFMLFQYLIGNTDFAVKRGPEGEGCCHNARLFAAPGADRDFIVLPYDFDQTGLVNPDYALVDERLGISRVTTRLYRGFCWQNDQLEESILRYNEVRADIEATFAEAGISKAQARRVQRFIGAFYGVINDPQELKKRLLDKCRGPESLPQRASPVSPDHVRTP